MLLHRLKLFLAPLAWGMISKSVRITSCPSPELSGSNIPDGPVIFACLHGDILPALMFVRTRRPVLLVSTSPDGEILVRALGGADFEFVRGQTGEQGARAIVELRRKLEEGRCIGLAVDGPMGPYGSIQPGVLQLGRLTGVPVLPLRAEPTSALVLRTWDRTVVPRPFSLVSMLIGPLLELGPESSDLEIEKATSCLADFFSSPGTGKS